MKINGVEVEDATEALAVKIGKIDVRVGAKKDANTCAAANAICRHGLGTAAKVHFSRAYVRKGKKWIRYAVPPALRSEIVAFDRGGEFHPGEYALYPIQPSVRLDAVRPHVPKSERKKKVAQRGNRPKRPYHIATGVRAKMMADWE